MKSNMVILGRKSLVFRSFQGFLDRFDDDQLEFSGDGYMPLFPPLMVGLVIVFMAIAIGISNAQGAVGSHTDGAGKGHRIHIAALGDQNSTQAAEDGVLPANRDFGLAWAAAADARAATAPLHALPKNKQHELATMAPAEPSDLTIGLRFTSPIYLAFFNLPAAPDPMPAPDVRQVVWQGFVVAMIMILLTASAVIPGHAQATRMEAR